MQFFNNARAEPFEVSSITQGQPLSGYNSIAPFKIEISYFNGLSFPITVGQRSGVKFTIPPLSSRLGRQFTIRVFVSINPGVIIDTAHLLDEVDDESPLELKVLREAMDRGYRQQLTAHQEYVLDYHVSKKELDSRGGSLYLTQLDIAISSLRPELAAPHPFCEKGYMQRMLEDNRDVNTVGQFGYSLRIVDNDGVFGDRFVNINQEIFKIPATKDAVLKSGVYLTSSAALEGNFDNCPPRVLRYGFEEADKKVGFYRSFEEAKTLGDVFAARERTFKEQQHQFKEEEHQWKLEKAELDRQHDLFKRDLEAQKFQQDEERRKWEAEFKLREQRLKIEEQENAERAAKLKAEQAEFEHQRQREQMREKDEYDRRSQSRKEYGELLKFIPVVITGLAAIFVAVKKCQGSTT